MAFEPICFIHASNLLLDHQLQETGKLSADISSVVQESTLIAFDHLVAACIENSADFLLLTGNCFQESDVSLQADIALNHAFSQLADHGIDVFIIPGQADPPDAWRNNMPLPGNVTVFFSSNGSEPVAELRDGKVIATIRTLSLQEEGSQPEEDSAPPQHSRMRPTRQQPFSIGVVPFDHIQNQKELSEEPIKNQLDLSQENLSEIIKKYSTSSVDYIAFAGEGRRQIFTLPGGLAHHPGPTQGQTPWATGPCGCTLIEVDEEGEGKSSFLPTAPVRWEYFTIEISEESSRDELLCLMQESLYDRTPESTEQLWLVNWSASGAGKLFEELSDPQLLQSFLSELDQATSLDEELRIHHRLTTCQPESSDVSALSDSNLKDQFVKSVNASAPHVHSFIGEVLRQHADTKSDRLSSVFNNLNTHAVSTQACKIGVSWIEDTLTAP